MCLLSHSLACHHSLRTYFVSDPGLRTGNEEIGSPPTGTGRGVGRRDPCWDRESDAATPPVDPGDLPGKMMPQQT